MTEGTKDTPSREMSTWLSAARCLPEDHDRAELVGRVWWPKAQGPTLVRVQGGGVYDLSAVAPDREPAAESGGSGRGNPPRRAAATAWVSC